METISRKFSAVIFYGFFMALGTMMAEVFTYNAIESIVFPWGYLPYGLLYILFIDTLIKKQVKDWKTVYLYGVLVGFITEGFMMKVIFYGWDDADTFILFGFAPLPALFLTFVFHPLVSFMLSVFIARNYFNFPFALEKTKHPWLGLLILPLYALIMTSGNGNDPISILMFLGLTLFVFGGWMTLLKVWGKTEAVTLGKFAKAIVFIITILFFIFAFFAQETATYAEVILPPWYTTILALMFTGSVFVLIGLRIRQLPSMPVGYTPDFRLWKMIGFSVLMTVILIILGVLPLSLVTVHLLGIILVGGMALGPLYFAYVVLDTTLGLIKKPHTSAIY